MRTFAMSAAFVAALVLSISAAVAQPQNGTKANCPSQPSASPGPNAPAAAPQKIEGTVTDIDGKNNMVSVRESNGQVHQFRGNPETIKNLKVGNKLELSKRATPENC